MRIFAPRCLLALVAAGSLVPLGTARVGGAERRPAPETTTREVPLGRGGRLTVQTVRGDITIDAWNRAVVAVKAIKTADSSEELAALPIDVRSAADELDIASLSPSGTSTSSARVDYHLQVPAHIDLKLVRTGRGQVRITGTDGRAVVRVENGAVRLAATSGTLDALTVNASVDASLAGVERRGTIRIETFNGDIRLRLPQAPPPHFEVRTLNGIIQSAFPLGVEKVFGPQVAHDAGGPESPFVTLVAVTGDIHISRR